MISQTKVFPFVRRHTVTFAAVALALVVPRIVDAVNAERADRAATPVSLTMLASSSIPPAVPNLRLAATANAAIRDPRFPSQSGLCQKWTRLVSQDKRAYGAGAFSSQFDYSAAATARNFLREGRGFSASQLASHGGLVAGDLVYKTVGSGGFGHVGIYVGRVPGYGETPLIAENSSTRYGRVSGAKGYRTLKQYGNYQVVVRLPRLGEVVKSSQ